MLEAILVTVEKSKLLSEPGVAVYYYGFKALTDRNNTSHFESLIQILDESGKLFPTTELKELYRLAINYCTSRLNMGQEVFFQKQFELYRAGYEQSILLEESDTISRYMFTGSVYSAIKTKNYDIRNRS